MVARLKCRVRPIILSATRIRHAEPERPPDLGQAGVIPCLLEAAACIEEERLELVGRARSDHAPVIDGHRVGERLAALVTGLSRSHRRIRAGPGSSRGLLQEGPSEIELGVYVGTDRSG